MNHSGAPANARVSGASIPIEICKPIKPRKFGCDAISVRTYVRTSARIRPGHEFAFVLDHGFEVLLTQKSRNNIFDSLRVNLLVVEICKNTALHQNFFPMFKILSGHFNST